MFLVVKSSSKSNPHKKTTQPKQKSTRVTKPKQKPAKKATSDRSKVDSRNASKRSPVKTLVERKTDQQERSQEIKKSSRPEDEVVTYTEIDFQLREIIPSGKQVLVGPPSLTI